MVCSTLAPIVATVVSTLVSRVSIDTRVASTRAQSLNVLRTPLDELLHVGFDQSQPVVDAVERALHARVVGVHGASGLRREEPEHRNRGNGERAHAGPALQKVPNVNPTTRRSSRTLQSGL